MPFRGERRDAKLAKKPVMAHVVFAAFPGVFLARHHEPLQNIAAGFQIRWIRGECVIVFL